ncbi:MAG: envelope stress response membrane protein PspB [Sphingomonas sp.]
MDIEGVLAISLLFLGLPWLLLHYITQWKRAGGLSVEDEQLLDELHETARRLEDRLVTIERIVAADHPHAGVVPARAADASRAATPH